MSLLLSIQNMSGEIWQNMRVFMPQERKLNKATGKKRGTFY